MPAHLEEVLDSLRVVTVALSANPLNLLDLTSLTSGLDVLEVNIGILTKVHDRSQKVE